MWKLTTLAILLILLVVAVTCKPKPDFFSSEEFFGGSSSSEERYYPRGSGYGKAVMIKFLENVCKKIFLQAVTVITDIRKDSEVFRGNYEVNYYGNEILVECCSESFYLEPLFYI